MLLHHDRPSFTDRRDSPALHAFVFGGNTDWDALVAGSLDMRDNPLPEIDDNVEPTFECYYCGCIHPTSDRVGRWDMPACSCCAERLGV